MKFYLLLFFLFIFSFNTALSAPSEEAKKAIYDQVTEGYFRGIQMSVANVPVSAEMKNQFIAKYKQNFNKQDFINKTYPCFMQYTDEQIATDPKIISGCVSNYLIDYSKQQQALFVELVAPQRTY